MRLARSVQSYLAEDQLEPSFYAEVVLSRVLTSRHCAWWGADSGTTSRSGDSIAVLCLPLLSSSSSPFTFTKLHPPAKHYQILRNHVSNHSPHQYHYQNQNASNQRTRRKSLSSRSKHTDKTRSRSRMAPVPSSWTRESTPQMKLYDT